MTTLEDLTPPPPGQIAVALARATTGEFGLILKIGNETAILSMESTSLLFDKIGDALEEAGYFDDRGDDAPSQGSVQCH